MVNERILWLCVCVSITIAAHHERARCIEGYEAQSQRLTKLSHHHYKVKKELKAAKAKAADLKHKGQQLFAHCKAMGEQCQKIIKGRLNCRPVQFLERNL
mgnify:CR=1 FL=1|tara:strand:+ start:160 stop:459 length:300 start_codon:yes stop_codon:yes gene_type:complete